MEKVELVRSLASRSLIDGRCKLCCQKMNLGTAELEEGVMGDTAGWKGKGELSVTVF